MLGDKHESARDGSGAQRADGHQERRPIPKRVGDKPGGKRAHPYEQIVELRRLPKVTQRRSARVLQIENGIGNGNEVRGSSSTPKAGVACD